jgi:2-oxoglutarate ferredoxin oxidoreductase subunit alpha
MTKNLVIADSDEHDPQGHITEDPEIRINMVKKRLLKGEGLRKEVILPDLSGDGDPDILLVSWGSTKGAIMEAASIMRKKGMRSGVLHFSQVWPLVPEHFMETLENAKDVVCVEGNATGQLAALIRKETGFLINQKLLRYDGLPITPEYILRELERI